MGLDQVNEKRIGMLLVEREADLSVVLGQAQADG